MNPRLAVVRGATASLLAFAATAQIVPDWYPVQVANRPPARWGHAMAYDAARAETVLYGPAGTGVDMWVFDGANWTQRTPALMPPSRGSTAMAFDDVHDRVVLFGGFGASGYRNDTWEWDGAAWAQRLPANSPPPMGGHHMVFDPLRGVIVLLGLPTSGLLETWEWNGTDWALRPTAHTPPPSQARTMAWDQAGQRVLVVSCNVVGTPTTETWAFAGADWQQLAPAHSVGPRTRSAMTGDPQRGVVVLFGGEDETGQVLDDTWEWDGTIWSEIQQQQHTPMPRMEHRMVYDQALNRVFLFGGASSLSPSGPRFADTWFYARLPYPASFDLVGQGCVGSQGAFHIPELAAGPESLPWLGETLHVELRQLPPSTLAFVMFGLSDKLAWLLPLPAELSSFLMPGCHLYNDILEAPMLQVTGGMASYAFAVPPTLGLRGIEFFCQGLVYDPPANARGFLTSNGAAGVFGSLH